MWILIFVVAHVVGFLSSIHAVMSTRTSQGAVAWAVGLNTMPYVAVPAYWVLGRSRFQGYVTSRRGTDEGLRALYVAHLVYAAEAVTLPGGTWTGQG